LDCCWHPAGDLVAAAAGDCVRVFAVGPGEGDRARTRLVMRGTGAGRASQRWGNDAGRVRACCFVAGAGPEPDLVAGGVCDGSVALWRLPASREADGEDGPGG
jgi:hypothetical protein